MPPMALRGTGTLLALARTPTWMCFKILAAQNFWGGILMSINGLGPIAPSWSVERPVRCIFCGVIGTWWDWPADTAGGGGQISSHGITADPVDRFGEHLIKLVLGHRVHSSFFAPGAPGKRKNTPGESGRFLRVLRALRADLTLRERDPFASRLETVRRKKFQSRVVYPVHKAHQ